MRTKKFIAGILHIKVKCVVCKQMVWTAAGKAQRKYYTCYTCGSASASSDYERDATNRIGNLGREPEGETQI